MSVAITYDVTCDAPDVEQPGEHCEAEFSYMAFKLSDVAGLRRQLTRRGWTYTGGKFRCPLHDRKATDPCADGHEPGELIEVLELSEVRRCQRCGREFAIDSEGTQAEVEA